jgi:hypothetical protein
LISITYFEKNLGGARGGTEGRVAVNMAGPGRPADRQQKASGSVIHKRDTSSDTILHTAASINMVAVVVAIAAVATIAVAVAMKALVTGTVEAAAEVQQQPKREQRDQAAMMVMAVVMSNVALEEG